MNCLRNLAGYKLIDQKRNIDKRTEINIWLGNKIEHNKRDWYKDVKRMKEGRLPRALPQYKTRWTEDFP